MKYTYRCPHCEKETIIDKPMNQSDRVEYCEVCESQLKRVYEAVSIKTTDGVKK